MARSIAAGGQPLIRGSCLEARTVGREQNGFFVVCNLCERRALHSVSSMLHTKQQEKWDLNGSNLNITGIICKEFWDYLF